MSSSPYAPAGNILNKIFETKKGLKSIAYNRNGELTCSKTTYAQCSHVLQHKPLLDSIMETVEVDAKNQGLLYILMYELLLGPNKKIKGGGALKRQLVSKKNLLLSTLHELQPESTSTDQPKRPHVTIPRYVRINTLLASTDEILPQLLDPKNKIPEYYMDPHVPDLLVLAPTAFTRGSLQSFVTAHQVVLQDKASCFSALCLVHGFDTKLRGDVLDACAAPGNKTCHVAALLQEDSASNDVLHALDMSKDRFQLLQRRMKELTTNPKTGKTKVQCHNTDFLKTTPAEKDFSKVTAILLDPSCSGSGMVSNHQDAQHRDDPTYTNDRINSLSNFQLQALKHATSKFPKVQRVVYSTCSVYTQENESVVQRLLQSTEEWELVAPKCLSHWERRGMHIDNEDFTLTKEQIECLVRVNPDEDASNGFFVACFQRKGKQSKNKKASSYKGPTLQAGMEFYDNQFDTSGEENEASTKEEAVTKDEKEDPSPTKNTKRKAPDDVATKQSKKRAKKLDWKKKQREKKQQRLLKQQNSTTEES